MIGHQTPQPPWHCRLHCAGEEDTVIPGKQCGHLFQTPPWRGFLGMFHREETLRRTEDTLDGICLSAGLGAPLGATS